MRRKIGIRDIMSKTNNQNDMVKNEEESLEQGNINEFWKDRQKDCRLFGFWVNV